MDRWLWVQLHDNHETRSPSSVLHLAGKPFIAGRHQLDDPQVRVWQDNYRLARLGLPHVKPDGNWRMLTMTERWCPALPPPSGYEHLSWMYWNKEPAERITAAILEATALDPAVGLLLCVTEGYPSFRQVVADVRAALGAGRIIVAFSKTDWHAWEHDDAATIEDELALWQAADLRYAGDGVEKEPRWPGFLARAGGSPFTVHYVGADLAALERVAAEASQLPAEAPVP